MKKVVIASLAQESNSFNPIFTDHDDFLIVEKEDEVSALFPEVVSILKKAEIEVITSISAYALPGGMVKKEAFLDFVSRIYECTPNDVDGIWLKLHGAMYVEDIGSGEEYLLKELRRKVGRAVPIAATMDMHANHTDEFIELIDVVRGYHTAPHLEWDYRNCNKITANALVAMINGQGMHTYIYRLPFLLPGEKFMTDYEPAKGDVALSERMEENPHVVAVSVFAGMAWVDCGYNGASIVITVKEDKTEPKKLCDELINRMLGNRLRYVIPAKNAEPDKAIEMALVSEKPYFITDSGDNVTGGAIGDNSYFLNLLLSKNLKGFLLAGIYSPELVKSLKQCEKNREYDVVIGGEFDRKSERVKCKTRLLYKKDLTLSRKKPISAVVLNAQDNIVVVTEDRCDFICPDHLFDVVDDLTNFTAIVVKLGYLFPDLTNIAKGCCIALTPGNCYLDLN